MVLIRIAFISTICVGVNSFMLLGSASWPVKEKNVIRIWRNDATIVMWKWNVKLEKSHKSGMVYYLQRMEENP